jgi:uncharacterized protein YlxW (UPF0749 family)
MPYVTKSFLAFALMMPMLPFTASAQTSTTTTKSATNTATDLSYDFAKLQSNVQTLQGEVQKLQSQESQNPADPQEMLSLTPSPRTYPESVGG